MKVVCALALVILSTGPVFSDGASVWTPVTFREAVGGPNMSVEEMERRYGPDYQTSAMSAGSLPNATSEDLVIQYRYGEVAVFSYFVHGGDGSRYLLAWQIWSGFDEGRFLDIFNATRSELKILFNSEIVREQEESMIYTLEGDSLIFRFESGTVHRITWQVDF